MGMAASQARLLTLTGRIHDIEQKAQSVEAQKLALATQKDDVYQKYCDALDATKYQVAFMDGAERNWVSADFQSLCTFQENRARDYALKDNKTGRLYVSKEINENYNKYKNDKYAFAWAMLGYGDTMSSSALGCNENAWGGSPDNFQLERNDLSSNVTNGGSSLMTGAEWAVYDSLPENERKDLEAIYKEIEEAITKGDADARDKGVDAFRKKLYEQCGSKLFEKAAPDEKNKTWDQISGEFSYYCRQWEAINQAGGCTVIDPQFETGDKGATWLKNMVEAGNITIVENKDIKGVTATWTDTSVATSTNSNYLKETQDDKDLKKAEAEYQHELSNINRKDTKFDTELSKLETERTAIKTEMDSIKQIKNDNIDRTFGIFS